MDLSDDLGPPEMLPAAWLQPVVPPRAWLALLELRLRAVGVRVQWRPAQPPRAWPGMTVDLLLADGTTANVTLFPAPERIECGVWSSAWAPRLDVTYREYVVLLQVVTDYLFDQVVSPADPAVQFVVQTFEEAQCWRPDDDEWT